MSERKVAVEPADLARQWPLPAKEQVHQELKRALEGCRRKMVVLDDDPTGVQTVHGLYVYTDWERETLLQGLRSEQPMFFVLTNSRGFTAEETERAHQEIGKNLAELEELLGL